MTLAILTSLITVIGLLALSGCCIIPCVRGLVMKAIDKSVSNTLLAYQPLKTEADMLKSPPHPLTPVLTDDETNA